MKKLVILASLIATPAFAANTVATAPAKDPYASRHNHGEFGMKLFDQIDANHDGSITKDELKAFHRAKFDTIDSNHDGKITEAEAKAAKREGSYKKMGDKNKKGHVTFDETFAEEDAHFADADSNHDGKVTKEEYKQHYLRSFEKMNPHAAAKTGTAVPAKK